MLRDALHEAGLRERSSAEPLVARPITGHSNTSFDISLGGARYAVRFLPDPQAPGRHGSAIAAAAAAWHLGLGPRPVWTSPDGTFAIAEWIAGGDTLNALRRAAEPATLSAVARRLRAFHDAAPALERRLEMQAILEDTPSSPPWLPLDRARAAWRRLCAEPDGFVPSHGDVSAGNILVADGQVRLIDWEFAAMAPRAFDLAYLAVEAGLEPVDSAALLAQAYGPPLSPGLIRLAMLPVAVMNARWCAGAPAGVATGSMNLSERASRMPSLVAAADI